MNAFPAGRLAQARNATQRNAVLVSVSGAGAHHITNYTDRVARGKPGQPDGQPGRQMHEAPSQIRYINLHPPLLNL